MSSQYEYDPTRISGSGEVTEGTAGAAIANRAVCYLGADGLYYQADADATATMPAIGLAMSAMTVGQRGEFLMKGFIGLSTWAWTTGSELYISGTAGQMSHVAGATIQQVGIAYSATQIFFNPSGYGSGTGGCGLLEGDTAYVGFDSCKSPYTNYFYCDGVADEVQINGALTYVNGLGGGSILLERGTYNIVDPITFPGNDLVLRGVGRDSFIDGDGLATGEHAIVISGRTDCTVKELSIQTQDGGAKTCHCIFIEDGADRFHIEEVTVVDSDSAGIWVEGTNISGGNILCCDILDTDDSGIEVQMDAANYLQYANFAENNIYSSGTRGIYTVRCRYSDYNRNKIINVGNEGIINGFGDENVFSENIIRTTGNHGIVCTGGSRNLIADNDIYDAGGNYVAGFAHGIAVDGNAGANPVEGNIIIGNVVDTTYEAGIEAADRADYTIISGNIVKDAGTYGIYFGGGSTNQYSTHGTIVGNNVDNSSDLNIYIEGQSASYRTDNVLVVGNTSANATFDGIRLLNADDVIIVGNDFVSNTGYGVHVFSANSLRVRVTENIYQGNVSGAINDVGTDTQVHEIFVNTIDPLTTLGDHPVVTLTDGATTNVYNSINLPLGFQEIVTAQLIVTPGGTGNMRWQLDTDFGKICANENYNAHSDSVAANETAVDINQMECLDISTGLTGVAGGDLIGFNFARIGGHANDTVNADCYYMGIRLRYV